MAVLPLLKDLYTFLITKLNQTYFFSLKEDNATNRLNHTTDQDSAQAPSLSTRNHIQRVPQSAKTKEIELVR
jgi:hypothetical protein